jgi:hypothetical protein
MKKLQLSFPLLALVLGITASAYTHKPLSGKQWHFTGTSSQVRTSTAYDTDLSGSDCSFGNLPCIIEVPHVGSNTDMQDLQAYLNNNSEQVIVANALETKN